MNTCVACYCQFGPICPCLEMKIHTTGTFEGKKDLGIHISPPLFQGSASSAPSGSQARGIIRLTRLVFFRVGNALHAASSKLYREFGGRTKEGTGVWRREHGWAYGILEFAV